MDITRDTTRKPPSRSWEVLRSNLLEVTHLTHSHKKFSHNNIPTILFPQKYHSYWKQVKFLIKTQYTIFSSYFITPLTENTCSVYRIPPQNTPRKTEHESHKQWDGKITYHKISSHHFYFYNFHNPTHTPSLKLISITNINIIKIIYKKFIKIFIKLISNILSNKFYKNI